MQKKNDKIFQAIYAAYIECLNCKSPGRENCSEPCAAMTERLLNIAELGVFKPDCQNCYYWEHVEEVSKEKCDTCKAGYIGRIRRDLNELDLYRKIAPLHVVIGWGERNTPTYFTDITCLSNDPELIKCVCGQYWSVKCNFKFCPDCGQRIKE